MLQRIQTIWMVLALLCGAALLYVGGVVDGHPASGIPGIVQGLASCIVLASIFSFKNRKRQLTLNYIGVLADALLIGLLLYRLLRLPGGFHFPEKGIELVFPLMGMVFLLIANVFIRRDERLVKSVDRLR